MLERYGASGFPSASGVLKLWTNYTDPNNYYAILGVSPDASLAEIRRAYLSLIKECHPDKGGDPERFRYLNQIWQVLSNPASKVEYDSTEEGSVYAGDIESDIIRSSVPPEEWGKFFKEEPPAKGYTYYATTQSEALALSWYDYMIAAMRVLGRTGSVRVGISQDNVVRLWDPNGFSPVIVVPQHIQPNFPIAFYLIIQTGYGQKESSQWR